jgi:hypothetical protein
MNFGTCQPTFLPFFVVGLVLWVAHQANTQPAPEQRVVAALDLSTVAMP